MKSEKIIYILFLLLSGFIYSQKTISGTISDEEGKPISSASVTIQEAGKDGILAYAISNSKGEYKVTFTTDAPNLELKAKAFNHKTILKSVSNADQKLPIKLDTEATEIKEVKLKAKLITARGDTLSYDVKAFDTKNARTLADVMRNMPGVEVKPDGSILHQGNPINKFYVDGKDLMEGGYGTITNSLSKEAIKSVQVLENHQPVKMLQGKIPSENAAINIKLKKAVTMTGRGELSAGGSPLLWNAKLTPMFFSKKLQWVVNYKANNVGEQVENEGMIFGFGGGWEGRRINASQNGWLNVETASTPNVPIKRYLFNNVHYFSANFLTNLDDKKEWEFKANTNYTNNVVSREDEIESRFLAADGSVLNTVLQSTKNKFFTDKIKGELIFTKNAKKGFFKNVTTYSQFWNADRAMVDRSNRTSGQSLESPTSSFQNSLSTIIPWKEKMVNLQSFISYQDDRQTLEIAPASYMKFPFLTPKNNPNDADVYTTINFTPGSNAYQYYRMKTLDTSHSANVSFTKKGWTFTPEIGFDFSTDQLATNFDGSTTPLSSTDVQPNFDTPIYENKLKFTEMVPSVSMGINYKSDSWNVFANFPINANVIEANDDARGVNKSLRKTTFTPNIFAQYTFASFWKASINGNISNNFGDIQSAYAGFMLMNPGGFSVMDANNPIPQTNSKSLGSRIEYRNPLNNLFFNINYRISDTQRNLISSPVLDRNTGFTLMQFKEQENSASSNSFIVEVGKYFPNFKTNFSVNFRNVLSLSDAILDELQYKNKNTNNAYGFKINNSYFSWMSIDYTASFSNNKQENEGLSNGRLGVNKGFTHNLATYFYPLENHTLGFSWDQVNSGDGTKTYRNGFFDASYQYTWSEKKIDFELKWMNIANRRVFETFNINAAYNSIQYTRVQLRPSQFLFTVKFNFK